MTTDINIKDFRQPGQEINQMILRRWSPRALSGAPISDTDLMALFEAARWAPSAYNEQPWRFIYVKNGTAAWDKLFAVLAAGNKLWTQKAAVLVLALARRNFSNNNQTNQTASFDVGAAWENLALEASARGLIAHGLSGFDYNQARINFGISEEYQLEAIIAIGQPGDKANLPMELQVRELPSNRRPLEELISEDRFSF